MCDVCHRDRERRVEESLDRVKAQIYRHIDI